MREADAVAGARRSNAISGAEFEELNPGLADYFGGIGEGVFVLRVSGATPAFAAGLRAGDIVQSVNGQYVPTIADLRNAVNEASGTITLRIQRKGKPATVTLRKE
jgi:S1-C subfamily serine protease